MSEQPRRIKVTIGENFNHHIVDMQSGCDITNQVTSLVIRCNQSTHFRAIAEVEFFDVDVEAEADVEIETTKTYRHLGGH